MRRRALVCAALLAASARATQDSAASKGSAYKFVGGFFGLDAAREERSAPLRGLSLVGAGFSRTGTKSTEAALIRLGHKIYDTRSMMELGHADAWVAAAEALRAGDAKPTAALLVQMEAGGFTATLDFPMNLFAPALAALRPEARVLMTVRDADKWFDSWRNVNNILGHFTMRPWCWIADFEFVGRICKAFGFEYPYARYPEHVDRVLPWYEVTRHSPSFDEPESRADWIGFHDKFRAELEAALEGTDRFMAFDVRMGWAPLLAHLGVDDAALAAEKFPHENDIDSLKQVRATMDVIAYYLPLWAVFVPCGLALLAWLVWRLFRRTFGKAKGD